MNQREYAKWLYEQTQSGDPEATWDASGPAIHNQWVRLAAIVQADRKNLGTRLRNGLELVWKGLGYTLDGSLGRGMSEIKDVIRELDPKGPIT